MGTETNTDFDVIGQLDAEEHQSLLRIRAEEQQLLLKIGQHQIEKERLLRRHNQIDEETAACLKLIEDLEAKGQAFINQISTRLGLKDGQVWAARQDGSIRLVK